MLSTASSAATDLVSGLPRLRRQRVSSGQRWVYSAGFNVISARSDTARIDCEVADLRWLADAGARVALLSHQGTHRGGARHLDDVARYLGARLGRPVAYCHDNAGAAAAERADAMADGEVVLFGNTRHHPGEERNDPALAARLARLGDLVAIGGFSKAHRAHASNVGILSHRPGFAADSLLTECRALAPWSGSAPGRTSVAVLGGVKPEKLHTGLATLSRAYDVVVPGGMVLNAVLAASGVEVGASVLGPDPSASVAAAGRVLASTRARVHLPSHVVTAPLDGRPGEGAVVAAPDGVPSGHRIVDFLVEPWLGEELAALGRGRGRALLAGTPGRYTDGFRRATDTLLAAFSAPGVEAMLLGGDTVAELPWDGPASTGGGSALDLLGNGTCAVLEALRAHSGGTP